MPVRARMRQFEQALRERGLKSTSQRDDIARVFFAAESHLLLWATGFLHGFMRCEVAT